jgi:hypothetical protein
MSFANDARELDNGADLPKYKDFVNADFNVRDRVFTGTLVWRDSPFRGAVRE